MDKIRKYEIEGTELNIPVHFDEMAKIFIEDYPDFIKDPIWTPNGHRVLFSGTDACPIAEEASAGGCPDCGSCRYFRRAGEHTWVGVCQNIHSPFNTDERRKNNVKDD